jgi:hypothetical protein
MPASRYGKPVSSAVMAVPLCESQSVAYLTSIELSIDRLDHLKYLRTAQEKRPDHVTHFFTRTIL